MLGLYNNNGSPVTANELGGQTQILGDAGYKVSKKAAVGTSDLSVAGTTVDVSGMAYFGGGTQLGTVSTGVSPSLDVNAVYTSTLTLTLAPNGTSLLIDSSFGVVGGSTFSTTQQTIASPLTLTFNEIVFGPSNNGGGATLMDNVLLTTNVIPEPATTAMFGMGLLGLVALQRCRSRSRQDTSVAK